MIATGQITISKIYDGVSVSTVDVWYYVSTSSTTQSDGLWSKDEPTWVDGKYIWSKTTTTLSDGSTHESEPVCITGGKGSTGTSVVSITPEYYVSTSKTTQTGGSWGTDSPVWSTGKYVWTRSKIVYKDPDSTLYTTPVCDNSWEAVNELQIGGRNLIQSNMMRNITGSSTKEFTLISYAATLLSHDDLVSIIEPGETYTFHYDCELIEICGLPTFASSQLGFYFYSPSVSSANRHALKYWSEMTEIGTKESGVFTITMPDEIPDDYRLLSYSRRWTTSGSLPTGIDTIKFTNLKLERGNKATDWTPAPEDIENQFTEVRTEISGVESKVDQNTKSITDKIWESDITTKISDYDSTSVKEIRDRVTQTETDITGIKSTVSDMETTIEEKADGTTVQTLTERVALAEQTASGFQQTVNSHFQTTDGNVSSLQTSFSQLDSKFLWLVSSGSSASSLTLTDTMLQAITDQFIISSPDGSSTIIQGGKIQTGSITTNMLNSSAIKSNNYIEGNYINGAGYSSLGTFLDLDNGMIHMPGLYSDASGNTHFKGEVIALSGSFGTETHHWYLGTDTLSGILNDYGAVIDGEEYSYLKATDNASIVVKEWQLQGQSSSISLQSGLSTLNNGKFILNTVDNKYYDFGVVIPDMTSGAKSYNKKFLYIRRADSYSAHPQDWEYLFRVDYDGSIWYKGKLIAGEDGMFLSITGGTITGDLTVQGNLNATVSSALKVANSITVNGKSYDGSSAVNVGTIGIAYGGTGGTTADSARENLGAMGATLANGYYGLTTPSGSASAWIRTTGAGILPYQSGAATNGHSSIGTSLWYFANAYIQNIYGTLHGTAEKATADDSGNVITDTYLRNDFTEVDQNVSFNGSVNIEDLTSGNLLVTGSARFVNGLYGTLTGNVVGTASSATKLFTARKIGNASFDGTADITLTQIGAAATSHTHTKSQITDFPTSIKNPYGFTIQLNGTSQGSYDGSEAKTVNVTASSVGALGKSENAVSASKWETPRKITLSGFDNATGTWDGSGDITLENYGYSANVCMSGTSLETPYIRIATTSLYSSNVDVSMILMITGGYANSKWGILKVDFRTDDISGTNPHAYAKVQWLSRKGYDLDSVFVKLYESNDICYADLYVKATSVWDSVQCRLLTNGSRFSFKTSWILENGTPRANPDIREYTDTCYSEDVGITQSANQLSNAVNINGTAFNGSGNITTASWGAYRNITIGSKSINYNGSVDLAFTLADIGAAATSHTHTKSQITDFPTSLKNPNALTLQFNGTSQTGYDGSSALTLNITPSAIGALAASANAVSATRLASARTINGTSFDGTANITTAKWGTARNITITDGTNISTAVSVDGSGNVSLRLPTTIIAALTGNASTASKLNKSVNINGTAFDGSADITTSKWGTARNITIGSKTLSVDGSSASYVFSLADIGAATTGHTHSNYANKITLNGTEYSVVNNNISITRDNIIGVIGDGNDATIGTSRLINKDEIDKLSSITVGASGDIIATGVKSGTKINVVLNSDGTSTINHESSSVVTGSYGADTTNYYRIPKFTVDDTGHITEAGYYDITASNIVNRLGTTPVNRATADGNGANIASTYLKLAGGTMTGNIAYNMYGTIQTPINIYGGDTSGLGIAIGAGGATIVGGGESALNLQYSVTASSEQLYLASDNAIYFYTNCNTIANRVGVVLNTERNFYPDVSNTGSLGTSTIKWASAYINNIYGELKGNADTATKATQDASCNVITDTYMRQDVSEINQNISFGGSVSIEDLTAGNILITGAARFVNGLYGTLTGDVIGTASNAVNDSSGNNIASTYLKGLSVSGRTITYTKGDGTTGTIPTQDTTYSPGTGLELSGTTFNHKNSVTAGTASGDASKILAWAGTFTIPTVTYDAQGHITGKGTTTMTMPANPNTWRGIQNNLTSTSTTDSLSAYQGKLLNDKFANYLLLAGGTMTGNLTVENSNPMVTIKNTSGEASLVFDRGSNANWKIVNSSGNLLFQCDWNNEKSDYFTAMTVHLTSGALTVKGTVTAPTFSGALSGNATSATKATQDASGNVITSKYVAVDTTQTISGDKTFTKQIVASGGIQLPSNGTNWLGGMTSNLCIVGDTTTSANYHPIIRQNTYSGNVFTFGGISDIVGFHIFKAGRTENNYDYRTVWNTNTGTLTHSANMVVNGLLRAGSFTSNGAAILSSTLSVTGVSTFTGKTTHNGGIQTTTLAASGASTLMDTTVDSTTASTSKTTGALKVKGGVGVEGQLSSNKVMIGDGCTLEIDEHGALNFVFG